MLIVCSVLFPVLWHLWIYAGSANSNFYYAITLTFNIGQVSGARERRLPFGLATGSGALSAAGDAAECVWLFAPSVVLQSSFLPLLAEIRLLLTFCHTHGKGFLHLGHSSTVPLDCTASYRGWSLTAEEKHLGVTGLRAHVNGGGELRGELEEILGRQQWGRQELPVHGNRAPIFLSVALRGTQGCGHTWGPRHTRACSPCVSQGHSYP